MSPGNLTVLEVLLSRLRHVEATASIIARVVEPDDDAAQSLFGVATSIAEVGRQLRTIVDAEHPGS